MKKPVFIMFILLSVSIAYGQVNQNKQPAKPSAARLIESIIQKEGIDAAKNKFKEIKTDTLNFRISENEFNAAGYRLIDMGMFAEAVEMLKMNVELFPGSTNVYDSLGEAYLFLGDKDNVIHYYKKIISINPKNGTGETIIKNIDNEMSSRQLSIPGKYFDVAKKGKITAIKSWLKRDPSLLNKKSSDGDNALHLAVYGGHTKLVEYLVSFGAEINERNMLGETPFNLAEKGSLDSIKVILSGKGADTSPQKFSPLEGKYFGQKEPGFAPQIFAPGIVSNHRGVYGNIVFSPDFEIACWTPTDGNTIQDKGGIIVAKKVDGTWTTPKEINFFEGYRLRSPYFSLNGSRLYFQAYLAQKEMTMDQLEKFYYVEKTTAGWSKPMLLDTIFNSYAVHWQFSLDKDENIYFSGNIRGVQGTGGIYFSKFENGKYLKPRFLPGAINSGGIAISPAISPNGDYVVFTRFITTQNPPRFAVMISFNDSNGEWTEAEELSVLLKMPGGNNPRITPDGKYIFIVGNGGSYWADAKVIEQLRPKK